MPSCLLRCCDMTWHIRLPGFKGCTIQLNFNSISLHIKRPHKGHDVTITTPQICSQT